MINLCWLGLSHLLATTIILNVQTSATSSSSSSISGYYSAESPHIYHVSSGHHQQVIIEHPSDQQAKVGDKALLKCRIRNLRGEPQWCIDDFCLGLAKKPPTATTATSNNATSTIDNALLVRYENYLKGRPRYRIVGDRARGEFNLLIEPVQLQDNMFFYCMVTAASETVKAVKSRKVFLTVLTYPKSLHLDTPVHVSLNKPSSIRCVAHQSRPPVRILIAINGRLITDEFKYTTEIIETPMATAAAQYQYDSTSNNLTSANSSWVVSGGAVVARRRYSTHSAHVSGGGSGLFIPPENLRTSYYDTHTNLTIDDISMQMQDQLVECIVYSFLASNDLTSTYNRPNVPGAFVDLDKLTSLDAFQNDVMSTKSSIQVDYAPEVNLKIVSTHRLLKEDDVISLVCETKATPPIHLYRWYIGKNHLNGVRDANLNLKLRKEMHLKTVTCEASNTVASVKASLQLNILFKPSFVRGSRTFVQIDKSACNRPLTLDCEVTSNPHANITWYRRRLNRVYVEHVRAALERHHRDLTRRSSDTVEATAAAAAASKMFYSGGDTEAITSTSSKMKSSQSATTSYMYLSIENDIANGDLYEDELVGTGPTYTIAAFNCANLVKNTKSTMAAVAATKPMKNRTRNGGESPRRGGDRFVEKRNLDSTLTSQEILVSESSELSTYTVESGDNDYGDKLSDNEATHIANESEYDYEYDEFEESRPDEIESTSSSNNNEADRDILSGENSDFGVYMCEARNRLDTPSPPLDDADGYQQDRHQYHNRYHHHNQHHLVYDYHSNLVRRYIKLNPNGPPIMRVVQTFGSSAINADDMVTLLMRTSPAQIYSMYQQEPISTIEVVASIGSSVTLTCIVEPLPKLIRLYWVKDNGKIVPNSKYTVGGDQGDLEKVSTSNEATTTAETSEPNKNINSFGSGFRVKFDNVTLLGVKEETAAKYENDDDQDQKSFKIDDEIHGVVSTDGQSVSLFRSVLTIKNIRKQDFGVYKCKSINLYGSRSVSVVLREKTLLDKINMNTYMSFIFLICTILIMFSLFVLLLMCAISKRARYRVCCCCFCDTKPRTLKGKNLRQNLHCELNSDKAINEWLASSKLSNDTTTTTTTTTTIRNGSLGNGNPDNANNTGSSSSSSSSSSSTATTTTTGVAAATQPAPAAHPTLPPPSSRSNNFSLSRSSKIAAAASLVAASQHHHQNAAADLLVNCSSLINGDYDNQYGNDKKQVDEESDDLEKEFQIIPTGLKSPRFNNYLLSSPLSGIGSGGLNLLATTNGTTNTTVKHMIEMSKNANNNYDHHVDECCSGEDSTTTATTTTTTSSTLGNTNYTMNSSNNTPPSRKTTPVRTHVLTNGNFNAKIIANSNRTKKTSATIVSTPSLSELNERFSSSRKPLLLSYNNQTNTTVSETTTAANDRESTSAQLTELLSEFPAIGMYTTTATATNGNNLVDMSNHHHHHYQQQQNSLKKKNHQQQQRVLNANTSTSLNRFPTTTAHFPRQPATPRLLSSNLYNNTNPTTTTFVMNDNTLNNKLNSNSNFKFMDI